MIGAILQPSYIPWRGYFHQIHRSDVFVFYDDVQYDKHGWRNRNRIKTANGPAWLTIPVLNRGCVTENILIKDVEIARDHRWAKKHWTSIRQAYGKRAPHLERYASLLETFYRAPPRLLADFTIPLTIALARALGIEETRFVRSSELGVTGERVDRLIRILQRLGVNVYLSGPSARSYIDPERFREAAIDLEYMIYDYPEYEQLYPPYDPAVSVLDLLFMQGAEALRYIWAK